jgi:hypothetical protein
MPYESDYYSTAYLVIQGTQKVSHTLMSQAVMGAYQALAGGPTTTQGYTGATSSPSSPAGGPITGMGSVTGISQVPKKTMLVVLDESGNAIPSFQSTPNNFVSLSMLGGENKKSTEIGLELEDDKPEVTTARMGQLSRPKTPIDSSITPPGEYNEFEDY